MEALPPLFEEDGNTIIEPEGELAKAMALKRIFTKLMEETIHQDFLDKKQYFFRDQTIPEATYRIINIVNEANHEQNTNRPLLTMIAEVLYRILYPLDQEENPEHVLDITLAHIQERLPQYDVSKYMYVVWLVGEEWDVQGEKSIKALEDATGQAPAWISDYQIVKKYFVSHIKTMDNCFWIFQRMDGLKIEGADPAKTVHEARLINNFGRMWGEHKFTDFETFKEEFVNAMDRNFGGQVGVAGPNFSGPVSTAGSSFVVPIALALTFLFIAQGLN
jgi:hypothetical protein